MDVRLHKRRVISLSDVLSCAYDLSLREWLAENVVCGSEIEEHQIKMGVSKEYTAVGFVFVGVGVPDSLSIADRTDYILARKAQEIQPTMQTA
jgi:hypothetical protein